MLKPPPKRPYLLRAMHQWITDSGHTPHVIVDAERAGSDVPRAYVQEGKIVLNLGYSATRIAIALVKGEADGKPGTKVAAGRMGDIAIGDGGDAAMADPFTFDKSNIEQFAKIF